MPGTTSAPEPEPDYLALEQQVCFALAVASRRVIGLYRPLLEPLGLTHPQYLVMLALWQHAPLTVVELAGMLHLDSATLSPLLKRLEVTGYVDRRRDPLNERAMQLTLTEEGRALREQALRIPPAIMARLDMGPEELRELHGTLTALIARTGDTDTGAGPVEG